MRVRHETKYTVERVYTVTTKHNGRTPETTWAPGNGTHEFRVTTYKEDQGGDCLAGSRYVYSGAFGCSRNYRVDSDEAAIAMMLAEHACTIVSFDTN
jgi:hypothetical protein